MFRRSLLLGILAILALIALSSCSSSGVTDPAATGEKGISTPRITQQSDSHQCFGFYKFTIDPENNALEYEPLRTGDMHLNALVFLEPPLLVNLTLESVTFEGNKVIAYIGLRHPFLGLTEFTGFDVCGVVITDGSLFGFQGSEIRLPKPSETRLVNADGYTRWWNPREFPHDGTMFGYKDGLLGLVDEAAEYASTINGYKYFTDSIGPDDPVTAANLAKRGIFSAGQKNVRRYEIQWDSYGLIFNYAIDACWEYPQGNAPWTAPDDFSPNANRPEAWNIVVTEIENILFNDGNLKGGDLWLSIDVYDWYNSEMNVLRIESPGCFPPCILDTPSGGGEGYSTYTININNVIPPEEWLDILITVECEATGYQGKLPGRKVAAYQRHFAPVSPIARTIQVIAPNGGEIWDAWTYHDVEWTSTGGVGNVKLEYSKDDFVSDVHPISLNIENSGIFKWCVTNDPTTNAKVRVKEAKHPGINDISDNPFTIILDPTPIWPYFGCDEKGRCLSAFDGTTNTNIKWTYDQEPVCSAPSIGLDGTIYCGIYKSNGSITSPGLVAIEPVDGSQKWMHFPAVGNYYAREPAVSPDGKHVYYGGDAGAAGSYKGRIYCVNTSDGSEDWYYQLSPASSYELIDGGVKIDADGAFYFQSLVPMGGVAKVWCLNPDGTHRWHHSIIGYSYSDMLYHCPCIGSDGNIYVTDSAGELWKFDSAGNSLWAAVYVNYETKWPGSLDEDNNFYVACDMGEDVNKFAPDGEQLWWSAPWDFYLHCGPAHDADGYIYATGGWDDIYPGYRLRKMDPANGNTVWEKPLAAITTAMMAVSADGHIHVGCGNGENYGPGLQCWDTDGNQIFNLTLPYQAGSPAIGADGTVYVEAGHILYAIGD